MSFTIVRKFDRPATTERGLIRKINRRLPEHHRLHKARPHQQHKLGDYYVIDHDYNLIVTTHISDLEVFLESGNEEIAGVYRSLAAPVTQSA